MTILEFLTHAEHKLAAEPPPFRATGMDGLQMMRATLAWLRTLAEQESVKQQPSRIDVAGALRQLQESLTHRQLTDMLEVFGIDALTRAAAKEGGGGIQARCDAILEFAMRFPTMRTAEGVSLSSAIVAYAWARRKP